MKKYLEKGLEIARKSKTYATKKNLGYLAMALFVLFVFSPNKQEVKIETVKAQIGNLVDEVSVTGSVKPIRQADLAFEVSGKVTRVNVEENQMVKTGDVLFELERNSLFAQSMSAQAQVEIELARIGQYESQVNAERARLEDLKAGAKPAELTLKESQLASAENRLKDAEADYQNAVNVAASELDLDYVNLVSGIREAFNTAFSSLLSLTDMQYERFLNQGMDSFQLELSKAKAAKILIGAMDAKLWSSSAISSQDGGIKLQIRSISTDTDRDVLDQIASELKLAMSELNVAFNSIKLDNSDYEDYSGVINTQKTSLTAGISNLDLLTNAISSQVSTNETNILNKAKALNEAANAVTESGSNLNLSKSSASANAISAQESVVKQAESNLNAQKASLRAARARLAEVGAQINTRVLKAPYDGVVTNIDIELGEIAFGNTTVAQILGEGSYEIIASIPETDISKVREGNSAIVNLDAYSDEILEATVTNINEAAETVDGVPVYEITLQFDNEYEFVKSGMTANIDILVDESANVVSVPVRAVDEDKVRILLENGVVELRTVKTGLRSSDGQIEILEGVSVDEDVVIYMEDAQK